MSPQNGEFTNEQDGGGDGHQQTHGQGSPVEDFADGKSLSGSRGSIRFRSNPVADLATQPRGILRKAQPPHSAASSGASSPALKPADNHDSSHSKRLKWDEDNLLLTEAQKTATMKIDEPKTPYVRYHSDTGEEMVDMDVIPEFNLADALAAIPARLSSPEDAGAESPGSTESCRISRTSISSQRDNEDDDLEDEEALEKHRRFAQMRAEHYNMREAIKKAKESMKDLEVEEDALPAAARLSC